MRTIFVAASMALACGCLIAQPIQINQASIAASATNRGTSGFPFDISQPGSYQLTSNLVVPAGVDGIHIITGGVTLDLNGFNITCLGPTPQFVTAILNLAGIFPTGTIILPVSIRNGSITGPTSPNFNGVYTVGNVQDLIITGPVPGGFEAISARGDSIVRHNIVTGDIFAECPSIVTDNIAYGNINVEPLFGANCVVWNNRAKNFNAPVSQ
jgi:hypothetical protein